MEDCCLADLPSGKFLKFGIAVCLVLQTACIFISQEKPLNPKLLFTVGSAFLDSATTLALKGDIDFTDSRTTQSGKFTIFINGRDSLSLLIEGPLNVDVFRMIVFNDTEFIYSGKVGWQTISKGEQVDVESYGIEDLSPDLTGLFAFPQYYLHSSGDEISLGEYQFAFSDRDFSLHQGQDQNGFLLMQADSGISAIYSHRHEFDRGYYPSVVKIYEPDAPWQLTLHINKLRVNPQIPAQVWERQ